MKISKRVSVTRVLFAVFVVLLVGVTSLYPWLEILFGPFFSDA
jgi:hypothetical protein